MPRLVAVFAGSEEAVSLEGPAELVDAVESAGEGERVLKGGAEALERLCEIVPIMVDALIKCC
jgi:hypothetical protein